MTTLHLLALAAYFLILAEYIAMRHRVICADSDARIYAVFDRKILNQLTFEDWEEVASAEKLYWNRGTK